MPRRIEIKVPSLDEYLAHDGLHYRWLWSSLGHDWCCPACRRSKFQIMRWTLRFPKSPNAFEGWVAGLTKHHDHSVGYGERGHPRFPETAVCDQCNAADGIAKKKLHLPSNFSFSPAEIGRFVRATAHGRHEIDYDAALAIYLEVIATPPRAI